MSKALAKFATTVNRSLNLVSIYVNHRNEIEEAFKKVNEEANMDDLVRSSVVLTIAAMDSYFTDVFAELFVPYLKKKGPTPKMIQILSDAGLDTKQALEMFSMERPYRRVRTLIRAHHEKYVTQDFRKVDDLMLAYGLKEFSKNIEKSLRKKRLVLGIKGLVDRRHSIVHSGDLNSHGKLQKINAGQTLSKMKDVIIFVRKADERLSKLIK